MNNDLFLKESPVVETGFTAKIIQMRRELDSRKWRYEIEYFHNGIANAYPIEGADYLRAAKHKAKKRLKELRKNTDFQNKEWIVR